MTVSTYVISNPNRLLKIEGAWNGLARKYSQTPFCLSGFIKQFMEFHRSRGWAPLVLVILADNTIVGIAPFLTRKKFGVRFVKFPGVSWFPKDFILEDQYREISIAHLLDFLFKTLRCHFVELTLPAESPNLRILKQKCMVDRIYFGTRPTVGYCVIPVGCTWDEFKASRGKNFRRKFEKIERNLDQAGSWKIMCVENQNDESDVFDQILNVEKRSWKEEWRTQNGIEIDPDLPRIWKAARYTARTEPNFSWTVWFVKLNDQTLAYTLVLQYKEVAFIIKTSYDERYKRFYPGIYVNNSAIHELFNKMQVRNIDFLTDLSFHRNWTSTCLPRTRVMMSRKGIPKIIMRASPELVEFLSMASPRQPKRTLNLLRARFSYKLGLGKADARR